MSFQRWLQNQPHCFFCVCVFSCRSLFIMFSNTACSLVPLPSCLLSIFVVIAIKYKFLARSHCLCSQWHYTFIHGWLFVAMHLAKEKKLHTKKKRQKTTTNMKIIYTERKRRKLTAGWTPGLMELELQHHSTSIQGQQKVRSLFPKLFVRNRMSTFAGLFIGLK